MPDLPVSPVLIWFIIGIVFYALELAMPGFIVFFFGIGAWCVALTVWLFDLTLALQLIFFIAASLFSLIALRSYVKNLFSGDASEGTDNADFSASTATGVVTETINPPAEGKIKYSGTFWRAAAEEEIERGTIVEVIEQQDLLVKVKPIK